MTKFFSWLSNVHTPLFVGILWAVGCLWNVSFNELIKVISPTSLSGENFDPSQSVFDFVSVILVAPLIETALFQALPYYLLNKIDFFRKRIWLIILVSSIIFSLLHIYSILYVLFAFFPGVLLMTGYHLRQGRHPFATIFMVHLMINATPLVYELIFTPSL